MDYTKGEWKSERRELAYGIKVGDDFIATVHNSINAKANANLIAQSPRMAKFLENLCAEYEDYGKIDESFYLTAREILKTMVEGK